MEIVREYFFQIVLFLAGALIGVIAALKPRVNKPLAVVLAMALISISIVWWYIEQNSPAACPYNGANDAETFANLIRGEENGALNNDIATIEEVYLEGATITDTVTGKTLPMKQHYQGLLSVIEFIALDHYNIEVVKMDSEYAWVIASDISIFRWRETGEEQEFISPPGAAHYIFAHDPSGCWKISHFSKQAENEPFP